MGSIEKKWDSVKTSESFYGAQQQQQQPLQSWPSKERSLDKADEYTESQWATWLGQWSHKSSERKAAGSEEGWGKGAGKDGGRKRAEKQSWWHNAWDSAQWIGEKDHGKQSHHAAQSQTDAGDKGGRRHKGGS